MPRKTTPLILLIVTTTVTFFRRDQESVKGDEPAQDLGGQGSAREQVEHQGYRGTQGPSDVSVSLLISISDQSAHLIVVPDSIVLEDPTRPSDSGREPASSEQGLGTPRTGRSTTRRSDRCCQGRQ